MKRSGKYWYTMMTAAGPLLVPIPNAPAFSSPQTFVQSDNNTQGIFWNTVPYGVAKPMAAPKDFLMSGAFPDCISQSDLVGTSANRARFRNLNGSTTIGGVGSFQHGIQQINDGDYQEYYGLDALNPLVVKTDSSGGANGFQLKSRLSGANFKIQNAVINGTGASGITANFKTTQVNSYGTIDLSYFRAFNNGQEGGYFGGTDNTYDVINNLKIRHWLSYNTVREGLQIEHCNNVDVSKGTIKLSGQTGGPGQNNTVQVHDSNGIIEGFIFDDAPVLWNLCVHGFTFKNCTFIFNSKGFIVDAATGSYFGITSRMNGQPVLFDTCRFIYVGAGNTALTDISETGNNWEIRNSIFTPNVTSIWNDQRAGGATNSLIGNVTTNGNTQQSIIRPSGYTNFTPTDFNGHGMTTDPIYQALKQGFRAAA